MKFTRHWVERHISKLKAKNACLTYSLMGDLESQDEATEGSLGAQAQEEAIL